MIYWIAELPDNSPYTGTTTRIAVDSGGVVHLVYVNPTTVSLRYAKGKLDTFFIFETDLGTRIGLKYKWTITEIEPPWADWNSLDLAVDSKGRAHLCFIGELPGSVLATLIHAVWDETAGQFARTEVVHIGGTSGLAMTIAKDDSVHIAYVGTKSNQAVLKYATRARDSDPFYLEDVDTLDPFYLISNLSIAAGPGGKIGISYIIQNPSHDDFQLDYAEQTANGWRKASFGWGVMGLPPNVPGAYFNEQRGTNSLVFDVSGVPHIAHFADGLGLRHATFTSPSWNNFLIETVDGAGQCVPAKILLDQRNVLHIAYQAQLSGGTTELRLATQSFALLGPPWTTATIDPSVNSGWGISAALDPTGQPHISYGFFPMANGSLDLKHIYAVNITALPWPGHKIKRPFIPLPRGN